jgi:glycosyltransferase involved in cell wall biosynthesis
MNGVSIIICAYNAAKRIIPTLQHLQKQQFNKTINWEIIVVDNASSDFTSEVASETWNQNPITDFSVVREEKPGLMHARRRGLESANYEIVSFIDDDNWVETGWVQKVADVFAMNDKIGACGGQSEAVFENTSPEWFPLFENSFAVGRQANESGIVNEKKGFLWGAGLSLKKSVWDDLQKRNYINLTLDREGKTLSSGGDTELCYAIRLMGYQLYYKDDLSLKHYMPDGRMNFSYLEKMSEGFGKANVHLNCYRVLLYPSSFILHPWWYEWLATEKKIINESFRSIFSADKNIILQAKARKAYWKGYASQTWNEKSQVMKYVASLKEIFPFR